MLVLLSPSKTQDIETLSPTDIFSDPLFEEERWPLVLKLKKMNKESIMRLMKIQDSLCDLHMSRQSKWSKRHTRKNSKQAIHTFTGAVYDAFRYVAFTKKEYAYMQKHIGILSGMYGFIRPLDLIQPYRLEMGTRLAPEKKQEMCKNLYEYWSSVVTQYVCKQTKSIIINLASLEYTKVIDRSMCDLRFIDIEFLQKKDGKYKQITIYSKKERGFFAYWMVKNNITSLEHLKKYSEHGYMFSKRKSSENKLVFTRKYPKRS